MNQELREHCYEVLAENLPMLRGKLRITQEDLAKAVGVSRQTITLIESKKYISKWNLFMALMFVFLFQPANERDCQMY